MSSFGLALQPIDHIASNIFAVDAHPPGYIFLVQFFHYVLHLGIQGSVRGPSFFAGVLTIPVVYALARVLVGRSAAVVAAALAVVSPMLVWYSREGRMYALTWLFVMLTFLTLALAIRRGRWPWLVQFGVCVGLSLYADISAITALIPLGVMIGAFALRSRDRDRRLWLRAGAAYLGGWVLFTPWLIGLPRQLGLTHGTFTGYPATLGTAWRLVLNFTGLRADYAQLSRLTAPVSLAALALVTVGLCLLAAVWLASRNRLYTDFVLCLTAGPAAICVLLVAAGSPSVLIPRVMGLAVFGVIFALAGAVELARVAARRVPIAALAVGSALALTMATSVTSLATVEAHGYNGQNWRPVAKVVLAAQPGDAVIYYPYGLRWMVEAYQPVGAYWMTRSSGLWQTSHATAEFWFKRLAAGHAHIFLIFYAAAGVDAPVHDAWFQSHGYHRVLGDPSAGYGILEYVPTTGS